MENSRTKMELKLEKKYSKLKIENPNIKFFVFKMYSKITKTNSNYFFKIQWYYPKLCEFVGNDICNMNTNFKDTLFKLLG